MTCVTGQEWSLGLTGSFEWACGVSIAGSRAAVNLSNPDYGAPAAFRLVDVSAMLALDRDAGITSATADGMTTSVSVAGVGRTASAMTIQALPRSLGIGDIA